MDSFFVSGYNYYNLPLPVNMPQGSMLGTESNIGVNPSSTSSYSDYNIVTNSFINSASPYQTYSFYLSASGISTSSSSSSNFVKAYTSGGTFTITASFNCNSQTFSAQTVAAVIAPSLLDLPRDAASSSRSI